MAGREMRIMTDLKRDYQADRFVYRFEAASELGLVRKNNEDALVLAPDAALFGVCDGLGGHAAGEVASALAVEEFLATMREPRAALDPAAALARAVANANRRIIADQRNDATLLGMGTTLSALWLAAKPGEAAVVHIGDSRVYRYHAGALEQLTEDHSPVFRLFKRGLISKTEMQHHPQKSLIERCLGIDPSVQPQILFLTPDAGDRFLIATDGLTDNLSDDQISLVLGERSFEGALTAMFEEVYRAGAPDNISAVLVEIARTVD
jgi:serine/threonine protein phosphatase PrpC